MTGAERGLLLLCAPLGQASARPLTTPQLRLLRQRVLAAELPGENPLRDLTEQDLRRWGYEQDEALRICALLARERLLDGYLQAAERLGIFPLTRLSRDYPAALRQKRGGDGPPVLFCAGNRALLHGSAVGLVGSRQLTEGGADFAAVAGLLAAREALTLVTGGAEGADRTALEACLDRGGSAVVFVPDTLTDRLEMAGEHCLLISETGFDLPFTAIRALSRNDCIHMLPEKTLVAQTANGHGGTWSGSVENLRHGWSELYVNRDGSPGAAALCDQGATPVEKLTSIRALRPAQDNLFANA